MDIDKAEKKPEYISFDVQARVDLGEISAMTPAGEGPDEPLAMDGTLKAELKKSIDGGQ